jgi:dehydrogenase/reductase SDR family protein 1
MMIERKQGLIINISSIGGFRYVFNSPYGIGKAACDRMAVDCGKELREHNVCMLSLYPGHVKTELFEALIGKQEESIRVDEFILKYEHRFLKLRPVSVRKAFQEAESIEFSGKIVVKMAQDKKIMNYSSRVVIGAEYAHEYGIKDLNDERVPSFRQINYVLRHYVLPERFHFLIKLVPDFLRVPQFFLDILYSHF